MYFFVNYYCFPNKKKLNMDFFLNIHFKIFIEYEIQLHIMAILKF